MSLLAFVYDRLAYIIAYYIGLALVVTVVQLDMLQQGLTLRAGNIAYAFVLSLVVLLLALTVDYLRQRPYLRQLGRALDPADDEPGAVALHSPATREQQTVEAVLRSEHARTDRHLSELQRQAELHRHFSTQWAHAMKTPVSVIALLVEQALDGAAEIGDEELRQSTEELLESIEEENERLTHGLELMLHVARLERFEVDLHAEQTNLVALAREVINSHKKEFVRFELFPRISSSTDELWVETDPKWMSFVVNQLVSNAIKYSPFSETRPRQLVVEFEQNDKSPKLSVVDNGIGIPPEDLPRVFDPFFTGRNGRLGARSTGMGLYLASEVCRRLGHELSIQSSPGSGTRVTVAFPSRSHIANVTKT